MIKYAFFRNALKNKPLLPSPSSLYTIGVTKGWENWLLVMALDQGPWPRELFVPALGHECKDPLKTGAQKWTRIASNERAYDTCRLIYATALSISESSDSL